MNRPKLNQPADLWLVDGSLRDVYVFSTAIDDWQKLLTLVRAHSHQYTRDGVELELPHPRTLFEDREHSHLLSIQTGAVSINCHFFIPEEIELDIDPREIAGPEEHASVLQFIEQLAEATRKDAAITAENCPDAPLLCYEHSGRLWKVCGLPARSDV